MRHRLRDLGTGLAAFGALLALIVGVPLALWALVGSPLPAGIPTIDEVRLALETGDISSATILKAVSWVVWLAWAQLVAVIGVEALARLGDGRHAPRIAHDAVHSFAAKLVSSVALSWTAVIGVGPAALAVPLTVATPAAAQVLSSVAEVAPNPTTDTAPRSALADQVHRAVHGDTWTGLAGLYLGSTDSWVAVVDANRGREVAPGITLDRAVPIRSGWNLVIPPPGPVSAPSLSAQVMQRLNALAPHTGTTAGPAERVPAAHTEDPADVSVVDAGDLYVVAAGDNLWSIAEDRLLDHLDRAPTDAEIFRYWTELIDANAAALGNTPDLIHSGDQLTMPLLTAGPAQPLHLTTDQTVEDLATTDQTVEDLATTDQTVEDLATTDQTVEDLATTDLTTDQAVEDLATTDLTTDQAVEDLATTDEAVPAVSRPGSSAGTGGSGVFGPGGTPDLGEEPETEVVVRASLGDERADITPRDGDSHQAQAVSGTDAGDGGQDLDHELLVTARSDRLESLRWALGPAFGALAFGLLWSVRRRRRATMARRPAGHAPPERGVEATDTERVLTAAATPDEAVWHGRAIESLARPPARGRRGVPQPLFSQAFDGVLEVVVTPPMVDPPPPWQPLSGGHVLRVPQDCPSTEFGRSHEVFPAPGWVTIGGGEGVARLSLEAVGIVNLSGDGLDGVVASVVTELCSGPNAAQVLLSTSEDDPVFEIFDQARFVDIETGSRRLLEWMQSVDEHLSARRLPSAFTARSVDRPQPLPLSVLVTRTAPSPALVELAARGGRGVAIIALDCLPSAEVQLRLDGDHVTVAPWGARYEAQRIDRAGVDGVAALWGDSVAEPVPVELFEDPQSLFEAAQHDEVSPTELVVPGTDPVPVDLSPASADRSHDQPGASPGEVGEPSAVASNGHHDEVVVDASNGHIDEVVVDGSDSADDDRRSAMSSSTTEHQGASASNGGPVPVAESTYQPLMRLGEEHFRDENYRFEVSVLGPVDVIGFTDQPRALQLGVLGFLATRTESVTADAVRDALWGGEDVAKDRIYTVMTALRHQLGEEVLPHGNYRLAPGTVTTDLARFRARVAFADRQEEATAIATLAQAMELVRGLPFSTESTSDRWWRWAEDECLVSATEAMVCDIAHRLSVLGRDGGDIDLAQWSAETGLKASPHSEQLTEDLIRAHLGAGRRQIAMQVVAEHDDAMIALGLDPSDDLHGLLARAS